MAEESRNKNNHMSNIKSSYILAQILNNLELKKRLSIIRYNKTLQNRLDIGLKDYKEYCQIEIEIGIIPFYLGKFINIKNNDKSYYHFYINDDKIETKRNVIINDDEADTIKIVLDIEIKSLNGLFKDCKCIEKINFINFNRNDVVNMSNLFGGCTQLKKINLSNFKTNKVTNMSYMFSGCSSLIEINLSNFITNNVTDMQFMFYECSSLKKLNLYKFNLYVIYVF